ncbi:MAG: hypothetical protein IPO07_24600 [Haliscomenobacter sp.]|nr:hypothetical protein [Haliscomenobacter sp.]MBK9491621.1 hypothetical protein [Haliscomenobacter sp.]
MYLQVKPETPDAARQTYDINNVYIYSNYNLSTISPDTNLANAELYREDIM